MYSLITFTNNLTSLVNELGCNQDNAEYDENDSFQYKDILYQIRLSILLLGNWKHLPNNLLDSKCNYKDVKRDK